MLPQRNNLNHIMRNGITVIREIIKQVDHRLCGMEKDLISLTVGHSGEQIERIILHHSLTKDSQTVSWDAIRQYHTVTLGWKDIGYHFGIERIGGHYEILIGRMMDQEGAHCRDHGMNRKSIGICFVGNFDLQAPPTEQWDLGVRLVKCLLSILAIPRSCVSGHCECSPHKGCPGKLFDLDKFRKEIYN